MPQSLATQLLAKAVAFGLVSFAGLNQMLILVLLGNIL
jgi:hypothetical protein